MTRKTDNTAAYKQKYRDQGRLYLESKRAVKIKVIDNTPRP